MSKKFKDGVEQSPVQIGATSDWGQGTDVSKPKPEPASRSEPDASPAVASNINALCDEVDAIVNGHLARDDKLNAVCVLLQRLLHALR